MHFGQGLVPGLTIQPVVDSSYGTWPGPVLAPAVGRGDEVVLADPKASQHIAQGGRVLIAYE